MSEDLFEQPNDLPAELAVLGSVVWQGAKALEGLALIGADFYRPAHEELWTLLQGMAGRREPIDPTSVNTRVMADRPGLRSLLLDLVTEQRYTATAVGYHARSVADTAVRRGLIGAAMKVIQRSQGPQPVDELVESARADIDGVLDRVRSGGDMPSFADSLAEVMESWEKPDGRTQPTGWVDIDRALNGGLRPGHLCVVGARPATGKSFVASVLATSLAQRGQGVLVASLEMSRAEVLARVVSAVCGISLAELVEPNVTEASWRRLGLVLPKLTDYPLWVDDAPHQTITHMASRARSVRRRPEGLGLVVVDYLQLIRSADRREPREQQVAAIARGLKLLARDLDCPVVALAQVNRGPQARSDKRPQMSDLRESGDIENSADEVILLHRDDDENPGVIDFDVVKNRHGRTGVVEMAWAPHVASIRTIALAS